MANVIHSRKNDAGKTLFRVWSTICDSYLTEEMDEDEVRVWTLQYAVNVTIAEHLRGIDERIQRTISYGTSSMIGGPRDLNGPWETEQGG